VLALSGIIALNIIATIAHHLTDPDKLREQAEEEAFSKVEDATLKQISKNADSLAAQLAPTLANDWMAQTQARYMSYVGTGKRPTIDATAQDVTPIMAACLCQSWRKNKNKSRLTWARCWLGGGLALRTRGRMKASRPL
jgi:hypothetical protein